MRDRLALHTWTLDTTPLAEVLRIAGETGWNAIELRRLDFERAAAEGRDPEAVLDQVRAAGLPVACVGAALGWMFCPPEAADELLSKVDESCRWAAALGCATVMSPVDFASGPLRQAAERLRRIGDLAARHGVRFALEHQSQAPQLNRLARAREVLALADHPSCGLLLDAYHLQRSGDLPAGLDDLEPREIAYVQYSDVARAGLQPGQTLDRLPPGEGCVPFEAFFQRLDALGYRGYLSYEAPNPAAWARDPSVVAREAAAATRARLPRAADR